MHIQIVTFNLENATQQDYLALSHELALTFAEIPGLQTKYWLADPAANTYGGVYIWTNRAAMDAYRAGEVAAFVAAHPNLTNITSKDFGILEAPTRLTRGLPSIQAA
ncbi:quinol monooxygenase YgiN [Bradyrhizobium sp. JR7.2]|uniref:YdhR family protein n=1 Tax=Bradyrhizobium TaxID=374 RepID=UPI0024AFA8FD|nr:YdhR family protein [Bradyrhizobium barranii]WFT92257.1 YdhR family protein [Bradyrhizobium barranii]